MRKINLVGIQHQTDLIVLFRDKERCHLRPNRPPETDQTTARQQPEALDTLLPICPELLAPVGSDGRPPIAQRVNLALRSAGELVGFSRRCRHLGGSTIDVITRHKGLMQNLEIAGHRGYHGTRSVIIKVKSLEKSSLIREVTSRRHIRPIETNAVLQRSPSRTLRLGLGGREAKSRTGRAHSTTSCTGKTVEGLGNATVVTLMLTTNHNTATSNTRNRREVVKV